MPTNPILDELHAIRAKLLADAGGDIDKLVAGIRARQAKSGRIIATGSVRDHRTGRCTGAAKSGVLAVENHLSPPGDR